MARSKREEISIYFEKKNADYIYLKTLLLFFVRKKSRKLSCINQFGGAGEKRKALQKGKLNAAKRKLFQKAMIVTADSDTKKHGG